MPINKCQCMGAVSVCSSVRFNSNFTFALSGCRLKPPVIYQRALAALPLAVKFPGVIFLESSTVAAPCNSRDLLPLARCHPSDPPATFLCHNQHTNLYHKIA